MLASDRTRKLRSWRPTPYGTAAGAIVAAVALVAVLTYYGAQTFTKRATNERAANEAQSFTKQSAKLANGDAFDGYIQILRFADDPVLNGKNTPTDQRIAIMQQDLFLNVNKFASLAIATRAGDVLASTDPSIRSVRNDQAFIETRANLNPANSDIVIPNPGQHGYVEYSTPLHEPNGAVWGILVARADPERLFGATLAATIDGGRNVIVNNDGLFAAGVPDALLGQPWHGSPLDNGGVRAAIAGVDSICGLALIGKGTQIDKGLNVASCMPVSLIQTEQGRAMGKQGLITIASAVLASVLAIGALTLLWRAPAPAAIAATETTPSSAAAIEAEATATSAEDPAAPSVEPSSAEAKLAAPIPASVEFAPAPPTEAVATTTAPPSAPDIDALTLISAYEERNARLAERLRESVQARLLVAASQADEAYKLAPADAEAAGRLHVHALEDLERIRSLELRSIGQELYPALVRLGLPSALKALSKELGDRITVLLDVDPRADALVAASGRTMLTATERLVLYRFALDAVRALGAAGATECTVSLHRSDELVVLTAEASTPSTQGELIDETALEASVLGIEAHGGLVLLSRDAGASTVTAQLPARLGGEMPAEGIPASDEDYAPDDAETPDALPAMRQNERIDETEDEFEGSASSSRTPSDDPTERDNVETPAQAQPVEPPTPNRPVAELPPAPGGRTTRSRPPSGVVPIDAIHLGRALESIATMPQSGMEVSLDLDLVEGGARLVRGLRATIYGLVQAIVDALEAAGAARCTLSVRQAAGVVMISAISETDGTPFDAAPLKPYETEIEAFGGYLAVNRRDHAVSVTAEVTEVTVEGAPAPADAQHPFVGLLERGDGGESDATVA